MDVLDIDRSARLLRHLGYAVVESNRGAVNGTRRLGVYKEYALALHDLHHGFYGDGVHHELLLRDRAAQAEPVAPGVLTKNELARNEITRASSCKLARNHRVQIRLVVRNYYDRSFFLEIILIGFNLNPRKQSNERYQNILSDTVIPPVARHASDIVFNRLFCHP